MFSPARALFFALNLAVFSLLALVGSSVPALGAPLPSPMFKNADFAPQPPQNASMPVARAFAYLQNDKRDLFSSFEGLGGLGSMVPRDLNTLTGNLNVLNNYFVGMNQHASNFRTLAHQPSASRGDNYNAEAASELGGFHTDLLGFQTLLDQLGSDDGLANYDGSDEIEVILKEMVNSTKYLLSDIDDLVYQIPGLGPTLGPIVYEIKCILDKTLDAVENLTDAILNAIKPLLEPLIGQATNTACNSGLQLLGICLLL